MSDETTKAIMEIPDSITVGNKEYTIYPLTLGKIETIGDKFNAILLLMSEIEGTNFITPKTIKATVGAVIDILWIITQENTDKPVDINVTKEFTDKMKWQLMPGQLKKLVAILKKQFGVEDILKNESTLKEKTEK